MIHVSGVGALGSFVLWELQRRGIEFTWDDLDSRFNAWMVSTGSINPYPNGDQSLYALGYRFWRDYAAEQPGSYPEVCQFLESTVALYARRRQPTDRAMSLVAELGEGFHLYRDEAEAFQLNVQSYVLHTRQTFAHRRRPSEDMEPGIRRLRCRGIGNVDTYALWGWQAPALLAAVGDEGAGLLGGPTRPAVHFSDPRLPRNSFYFLPVPGYQGYWWVGSDIVLQRLPQGNHARALDRLREFGGWGHKLFGHLFTFTYVESQVGEGWRPIRRLRDAPMDRVAEVESNVYQAPPLSRSGIQCGPLVAHRICDQLFGARRMPVER